jgi:hypothetical protein
MSSVKEMLLRHLQNVVRGFVIIDHVLRRRQHELHVSDWSVRSGRNTKPGSEPASSSDSGSNDSDQTVLSLKKVIAIVVVLGPVYGASMGAYAFVVGQRSFAEQIPQLIYSGIKVPLLILLTVAISLPSFFVINTLLGLRDEFREALRAIVSAQAGLAIVLVSLFPLTLFIYVSLADLKASYSIAILVNAAMFGLASLSAQVLLRGYYERLVQRSRRHLWMVRMWIFVYAFVGIQAGYVLRPFIGNPNVPTTFLRKESFQNAYVKLFELIWGIVESFA